MSENEQPSRPWVIGASSLAAAAAVFYLAFPGAMFMASQALVNRGLLSETVRRIALWPSDSMRDRWESYDELSNDQLLWLSRLFRRYEAPER